MTESLASSYTKRYNADLLLIAEELNQFLEDLFKGFDCVNRISTRAKKIDSFLTKASLRLNGASKYKDPLVDIQDQVGALIVVRFLTDVDTISSRVEQFLRKIEHQDVVPESESEFGYVGRHFVLLIPTELSARPSHEPALEFFELQIKTLFQYAWSETNHALGYKPQTELNREQKRMCAYVAAQAWGADKVLDDLRLETPSKE